MKVAFNATSFNNHHSGAKNRFIGIYGQLFKQSPEDEFFVFEPNDCKVSDWFSPQSNVRFIQTDQLGRNPIQRYLKGLFFWSRELKKINPDIFETFHFPLVKSPVGHTILTIHDIRYVLHPSMYSTFRRITSRQVAKSALEKSDLIITVSNAVKEELLAFYPGAKVNVLHNGVDEDSFRAVSDEDLLSVRAKFGLPQKFLLSVGHIETRKNYPRLLKAISILKKNGHNFYLVIVGTDSGAVETIRERIHALRLSDNVKILSDIVDVEIRGLYHLCSLFVFPSIYEGFGIPLLEAMVAKCPMVISDLAVFREITENQCLYFDQNQEESIADAILKAVRSPSEQKRQVDYGLKRVEAFKYHKLAQDLRKIYRQQLSAK